MFRPARWVTGIVLGLALLAVIVALLLLVAPWPPVYRCPSINSFTSWAGCTIAAHETLAAGLIAAAGALWGAWLAFSGLKEQIDLAKASERAVKRVSLAIAVQTARHDVEGSIGSHSFVKQIVDGFPDEEAAGPDRQDFALALMDMRSRAAFHKGSLAASGPMGENVEAAIDKLRELAQRLGEEMHVSPDAARKRFNPSIADEVAALRRLERRLEAQIEVSRHQLEAATAEQDASG